MNMSTDFSCLSTGFATSKRWYNVGEEEDWHEWIGQVKTFIKERSSEYVYNGLVKWKHI